jgi:acyl carrier protein
MNDPIATATRPRVVDVIIDGLSEVLGRDLPEVTGQTSLINELGLDSTSVLDLLMAIEERLDLELDTECLHMGHFATVDSLAEFVSAELEE